MPPRRYARIAVAGEVRWAESQGSHFSVLRDLPWQSSEPDPAAAPVEASSIEMLSPFCGRNVVGLAYNYTRSADCIREIDEPLVFLKGAHSATLASGLPIKPGRVEIPAQAGRICVGAELAILISKYCFEVTAKEARDCILGFCVGSDITAQDTPGRAPHLASSKALPGFAPLSPLVVRSLGPCDRAIETTVDGRLHQASNTREMILDCFECVSLASRTIPLVPGDIVMTGTPEGWTNSVVRLGSRVQHKIEGIGVLEFEVVARPSRGRPTFSEADSPKPLHA